MGFKDDFDSLWQTKTDKETAVTIRSQAESVYNQIVELIQLINDNSDIEIKESIRDDFIDLRQALIDSKAVFQQFIGDHPEFINWRP